MAAPYRVSKMRIACINVATGPVLMAADYDGVGIMVEGVEWESGRRVRGGMKNVTLTGKMCVSK